MSTASPPRGTSARSAEASPWRSRIVGHADVPPAELLAHPLNYRRHNRAQRRAMRAALRRLGWIQTVIVNRTTGLLIDGHLRVEEALARGEASVPVTFVDLTPDEERLVLATFDPIGAMAAADSAALDALLEGLGETDSDLQRLLDDLGASIASTRLGPRDDDLLAPADTSASFARTGQIWGLGGHRILVSDALDAPAVSRLLAGERPQLLLADPPWGVQLDLRQRHARDDDDSPPPRRGVGHRRVQLAGDSRVDWSPAFSLVPSIDVAYVWFSTVHVAEVAAGLERIGFEVVSEIVWKKSRWTLTRRWYQWSHESALVARRRGARLRFRGGRGQGTVWEAPSPKLGGAGADDKVDHPAQKPLALYERPIQNHLPRGGLLYDPFLGSGTALIAAERTGRRCLGVEIDPAFVQLTIERWQSLTGQRAELIDGGS
jgi:ParB-like chromosome segregation protein Spo0J